MHPDKKVIELEDVREKLSCSERTAYRYLAKYRKHGPPWIIHGLRGKQSNNKGNKLEWVKKYALQKKYEWFGPTLLAESLIEDLWRQEDSINAETLRLKMIERWTWICKKGRRKTNRKKRDRRKKKGMMAQFDGSYHIRLEDGNEICMLLSVDDATSELMRWTFTGWESLADMLVYREWYFKRYGKPQSIYLDCHATYKVNHGADQFDEETKTRFSRGMQRLWVEIIYSKCPEWKWRIERSFRTHQDRMIKKMRLAGIKTKEAATAYFDEIYREEHNKKFSVEAAEKWDVHMPFSKAEQREFKRYFALESKRTLRKDWTVWYQNKIYQISKWQELHNGKKLTVKENIDWEVRIYTWKQELEVDWVKNKM